MSHPLTGIIGAVNLPQGKWHEAKGLDVPPRRRGSERLERRDAAIEGRMM
jgi:hypothetical protein